MRLGDRIKLHFEKKPMFEDGEPTIVDGEFIVIGISYELPHCFNDSLWSHGFNSFEYGERQDDRPDIVRMGSIYVPTPEYLDKTAVDDLHYDKKIVSWEVLS